MDKKADPTNPVLQETLSKLEESDSELWNTVAGHLGKVNRSRPEVNVSDIERAAEEGEKIVVPGKVLGTGRLTKNVTVAAFKASRSAREKITENGELMFIQEMMDENPDGKEVKIVK